MARLDVLRSQRDETITAYEALEADAGAEPTADQQSQLDAMFSRAEALDAEIAPLAERATKLAAGAAVLARVTTSTPIVRARLDTTITETPMTAGEFLSAYYKATELGDQDAKAMIMRTVADQKLADVTGIVPKEIVGPLLNFQDASRPVFASFTSRPMPQGGKTFSRPQITQHVTVAKNNLEKTESASRKMLIGGTDVSKNVFRGTLDISTEAIDWTDPGLLSIVVQDFLDQYAIVSEGEACTALTTAASATSGWLATSIGATVKSITDGIQAVYTAAKRIPDTLWLSLDSALALAAQSNTPNDTTTAIELLRRSLTAVGFNISFVIGPQLPASTRILGSSGLIESYEQQKGLLQAVNVPLFGLDIGYAAYLAFFGVPAGFVKLA